MIGGVGSLGENGEVVEWFNPTSKQWCEAGSLHCQRYSLAAVSGSDKIFAVGGLKTMDNLADDFSLEIYDPARNTWSAANPLPTKKFITSTVYAHDKVYVFGGEKNTNLGEENWFSGCEVYNPETSEWQTIADTGMFVGSICAVTMLNIDNEVYIYPDSEEDGSDSLKYNPSDDTWNRAKLFPLQKELLQFGMSCLHLKMFFWQLLPEPSLDHFANLEL